VLQAKASEQGSFSRPRLEKLDLSGEEAMGSKVAGAVE